MSYIHNWPQCLFRSSQRSAVSGIVGCLAIEESHGSIVVAIVAWSPPTAFQSDSYAVNTVAKTESGSDDRPITRALCKRDGADHFQGSVHQMHATVEAIVKATATSCNSQVSLQNNKMQKPFRHSSLRCLFPGLSSLMVEILHRMSPRCSSHEVNQVIVDGQFTAPKQHSLQFLQQKKQLCDKVQALLLPALQARLWRGRSVSWNVHFSFLRRKLTVCAQKRTPHILMVSSAYFRKKALKYC